MKNIFVVDDNPFMTERIGGILEKRIRDGRKAVKVITDDEYIWEIETDDRFRHGDVVLSDLYPAGYWLMDRPKRAIVPPPRSRWPWRVVERDHPTRIASAVQDVIENYMSPLASHAYKPTIVVYTHVLTTLYRAGMPGQANKIKQCLLDYVVREPGDIIEKVDRIPSDDDLAAVADQVLRRLEEVVEADNGKSSCQH